MKANSKEENELVYIVTLQNKKDYLAFNIGKYC
jgi:hypothetical protein